MSIQNEFSHPIRAESIAGVAFVTKFEANGAARKALAERYNILSVESVTGQATLKREADGFTIHVTGQFSADVTQACVVSLEGVPEHIESDFENWYLDETQVTSFARARKTRQAPAADADEEMDENPMPDEREDPETVVDGVIDIGELVAQYLSLELNPFPHSEGAKASGPMGDEAPVERESPFAGLKDLLDNGSVK